MVAIVIALVPATALTAQRVFNGSSSPSGASTDLPIPPVSPSGTTSTAAPSSPPTTPAASQPTPAERLTKISPDTPRRITSGTLIDSGFDSSSTDLDASSDSEVARWGQRGSPGSPGTDTVYVFGRVRPAGDSAFADLSKVTVGATVSIRTDSGTMTYTVSEKKLKAESGLAQSSLFTTHQPGRLVLVGIRYDDTGSRLDKVLVVTAQLTGAKKA